MLIPLLMLAMAPAPGSSTTASSATPANDPHKLICRRLEQTGSRLGSTKVCMTKVEWAEKTRQDQEDLKRMSKTSEPGN